MTISAHVGNVKATHDLIKIHLCGGHIQIEFLSPERNTEFTRRLAISQARDFAAILLEAAKELEEHLQGRAPGQ